MRRIKEAEEKRQAELEAERQKQQEIEDQIKMEQEAKKEKAKLYRETCKDLVVFCNQKMPGTKYDKFYIAELVKKYPKQEQLDELVAKVKAINQTSVDGFVNEFLDLVNDRDTELEKQKEDLKKKQQEEEEQRQAETALLTGDWTHEDIAMLTKGITKFPPGTVNRWKVIADFVGKPQKAVIQKAKDIQEKQQRDVEAKRQAEVEKKERLDKIKKEAQEKVRKEMEEEQKQGQQKSNGDGWSVEQQKQLETGLRQVPATVATKERFLKIAEGVEGKSAKECFERFKELVAKAKGGK
jgi:DnaJ family protein C protein 2